METEWFFQQLEEWAERDDDSPCDPDGLAEVRSKAIQCVYAKNHGELARLHEILSTIGAKLSQRLARRKIPTAIIQAAEIPMLAAMVHGTLFIMEREDPAHAVQLIAHGPTVLKILIEADGNLNLDQIRQRWPNEEKPSLSTISRAIAALEEAGFIQRTGATRGRKFQLLAKSRQWLDLQPASQPTAGVALAQTQQASPDMADDYHESLERSVTKEKASNYSAPANIYKIKEESGWDFRQKVMKNRAAATR